MPELPEVETVVRGLRTPLIGRTIAGVWYERANVIQTPDAEAFAARIVGQSFRAINRRAKYVVCELDHDFLLVHLRMTGRLYVGADDESIAYNDDRWVRLRLGLGGGEALRFSDSRRFGRAYLTSNLDEIFSKLGPEPLADEFTEAILHERMAGRQKVIKALLLDQEFVAGIGNIYADEALFRAGIHPLRAVNSLSRDEIGKLHIAIREALQAGISHEGASISWYRKPDGTQGESQKHFYVYGREDEPCLICGTPIQKIRVAQRGTHFCPSCQPKGI